MKTVDTTLIFDPDSYEALLQGWSLHVRKQREKHDLAATRYDWYNRLLSGVVAVLSAVVGTAVFTSLEKQVDGWIRIVAGLLSFLAAVLSSVTTSFNFAQRAEAHRAAGVRYKCVLRELEQLLVQPADSLNAQPKIFDEIRKRLDELELQAPVAPMRINEMIERKYQPKKENTPAA